MEAVNSIASAASRAIWGENATGTNETQGIEPVSGQTGDVKAGEPYDKGNEETGKISDGTYLNDQGKEESTATSNPIANPSSTTADTSAASDTTSTKPTSSTNDNSLSDNSGAPPAPSSKTQSASDPATDPTATTTSKTSDPPTTSTSNTKDDEDNDTEDKKTVAHDGIQETHSGKDDGAKYDSFKTAGGPHIDHPSDDGRVGPDVPKGTKIPGTEDMNDDAEANGKSGHDSEGAAATTGSATKHESASRESIDSAEKESGGKEKFWDKLLLL
ncbi:hypothetical protein BDZ45DRAFT_697147 [Acephala macrosclerotiorum]|nr:hypothetical protein BDZ45DRAFT_697147 [Acephala macrosclerotiorum]